jgi:dephospho-CoA kinase
MIFGVTGYYGSGKDEFAKFLENEEFTHISLSNEIRKELKKKKKRATRKNLIDMGNEIRRNLGPAELANRVLKKIKDNKDYVLTSIRNKEELLKLKKEKILFY